MKKSKKKLGIIALVCLLTLSVVGLGYSAWQTNIELNGNVTASGKWNVVVTDVSLNVSKGTSVIDTATTFKRTGTKGDSLIAATISSSTWISDSTLLGTQSDEAMSKYTNYFLVDSTKYDLTNLITITKDYRNEMVADETTLTVSDHLNMYYRFVKGENDGSAAAAASSAEKVVDGLLKDVDALLKETYPDTYKNYSLVSLSSSLMKSNYVISSYVTEDLDWAVISEDKTGVTYQDVVFSLPGAWAQYSVTVTNKGTVNANLEAFEDMVKLDTDSKQLIIEKPYLEDETLAPNESCTLTFIVKTDANITEDLDASGKLTVKLPYVQDVVEEAPSASHTHK